MTELLEKFKGTVSVRMIQMETLAMREVLDVFNRCVHGPTDKARKLREKCSLSNAASENGQASFLREVCVEQRKLLCRKRLTWS